MKNSTPTYAYDAANDASHRLEAADKAQQEREEGIARETDEKNRTRIHASVIKSLARNGINLQVAGVVVDLIRAGKIPHIKIEY